ncbi:MAG: sensor domain-containing diguanylate cyclase [Candidatus Omnitrophota bacterium]|nr:sensor domain-containing diguanylate cyclase [Candidatus Omnitrophota bacterium]
MTEKQKIQLSNSSFTLALSLLIPLLGLFVFGAFLDPQHLYIVALGLIAILLYLYPQNQHLSHKEAEAALTIQDLYERINLLESEIGHERQTIDSFRKKIVDYSQMKGLTERLSLCLTMEDTSRTLSTGVNNLFGNPDTTIILYLFHSHTGELGISSSHKGQMRVNLKAKKGDVFDQWIVKTMQPLLIEDVKSDYRFDMEKIIIEDSRTIRSLIGIPLMVGDKALGILRIDSPQENYFNTEELRFLRTIGDLGAIAIENAQLYERVEQLAIKDSLTGLYLRRYLLDRLPEEVSREMYHKKSLAFIMIDLDFFKQYNDKFGHVAGDIVLRTIGLLLKNFFGDPGTLVCRYGGEEFAVLLPECSKAKAIELAEQVRKKIQEQTILLRREQTHITVSIGVAAFPKDAQIKEELIHQADQALYKAKQEGRNRVCSA